MRCFVALEVPDKTRALSSRIRERITDLDPAWQAEKWVALENLHVTLAFLGDVGDEAVREFAASLRSEALDPFTLGVPTIVAVPGARDASMIWIRYLEGTSECSSLAALVRTRAEESGLVPKVRRQRFAPHVTLVRSRGRRSVSEVALSSARELLDSSPDRTMSVSFVRVFSSSLGRVGPTYTEIATVPFLGTPTR